MIIIQWGFGLSIKRGHAFGVRDSDRKMMCIRLPFLSFYILNRQATRYFYECGRAAFNDANWFIENHDAVRNAKRKAEAGKARAWIKCREEAQGEYQDRINALIDANDQLKRRNYELERDVQAYKRLAGGKDA